MEFTIYSSFQKDLKEPWNNLLAESVTHVPFLRYEYLLSWWQTRGGGEWPQDAQLTIVAAREGDRLVGIAPLFFATWEDQPTLLLVGSIEISDYLDLITRPGDLLGFAEALLPFLQEERGKGLPDWQRLDLYNVLESSPSIAALQAAVEKQGWGYHREPFRPSLSIPLPGDWETYLSGIDKKQRHEIRRKMRRAETSDVPVHWYCTTRSHMPDGATLDSEIDDFLGLMTEDPEKAKFLSPLMRENFRTTIHCAFNEDCLMLAFLTVDGQKAAGYLNFDYLDQLWVYNSGMSRAYNEYSPGWVLLGDLLRWANENGKTAFDFMRGDEDYKIRFGAQKRDVLRLTVTLPGK